nr:glycoside hydrolase family 88 protein [Fibrisoma limi]
MADTFMARHNDSIVTGNQKNARWDYEQGLVLKAIERVWNRTGDGKYYDYILNNINQFVGKDGSIRTYKPGDYNLDNIATGRLLLMLSQQTQPGRERYQKAATLLRQQLKEQPRTKEGGFWHKQQYPNQMWLDGLYMAEPFYAEHALLFNEPTAFDDIANQFALIEKHLIDPKTGLLYHGYDESRQQRWANSKTGQSPTFWGRALGWYAMSLVDVLDYFPDNHPERTQLVSYLQRLMPVLVQYQDPASGGWYQIIDQGSRQGNYIESSATSMLVYALAKGVRKGYLPNSLLNNARRGYQGVLDKFVKSDTDGLFSLDGVVSVGGLGGEPYRDGSYAYYLSEPIRKNDLKGIGSFIMASVEMEIAAEQSVGAGKTVGLDYYFNNEYRSTATGQERFHYTWEDRTHSGFWLWGSIFQDLGANTQAVTIAPTSSSLNALDVYIIVDPDSPKEAKQPNYVRAQDVKAISDWVKAGGVLVLMANDTANCEIPHFNQLAQAFGIRFMDKNRNSVEGTKWEQGRLDIPANHPIFKHTNTVYIKDLATLDIQAPATAVLKADNDVIIAVSQYGKGTVFAVGDPWLYNEYTDGRRIPATYQNFSAAKDLAIWLLIESKKGLRTQK